MRVVRWVVTGLGAALLAGFLAGFLGALLAPRRGVRGPAGPPPGG